MSSVYCYGTGVRPLTGLTSVRQSHGLPSPSQTDSEFKFGRGRGLEQDLSKFESDVGPAIPVPTEQKGTQESEENGKFRRAPHGSAGRIAVTRSESTYGRSHGGGDRRT